MYKRKNTLKKKKPKAKALPPKVSQLKPSSAPTPTVDYTERYKCHPDYKLLCARTHAGSYGKCCVCLTAKSEEIHHSRYLGLKDTPGKNVFGCCVRCHDVYCHSSSNWIKSKSDPLWGNHNTAGFEKRLQTSYKILNQQGAFAQASPKKASSKNKR